MNDDKPDFGSTTAVIAYVRSHITLKGLWSAIGTLVTALIVTVTWLVTMHINVAHLQESGDQRQVHDAKTDALLQQLVIGQTAMNGKIDVTNGEVKAINGKVDGLVDWRADIERAAEAPPHARRKR